MQHEVIEGEVLWIQQCAQRKALVGAAKKCKEVIDVLFLIQSYLLYLWLYFYGSIFVTYIFVILHLCIVCFIDLLRTGQCCLYHNGVNNANEMLSLL